MTTAKGIPTAGNYSDVRMATGKLYSTHNNDVTMETARGGATMKQTGFQLWERELLSSPEIKRKATVAQLCRSKCICCVTLLLFLMSSRLFGLLLPDPGLHFHKKGAPGAL